MDIFLKPGDIFIADRPAVVSTILGSCLAVTIFNQRLMVGGICHAQMPKKNTQDKGDEFHYVDTSFSYMVNKFNMLGIHKHEMEMKLFGGANVLGRTSLQQKTIGEQNIQTALEIIEAENFNLVNSDVGGNHGRKLKFYTDTGTILMKRLKEAHNPY